MKKILFLCLMLCTAYAQSQDSLLFAGNRVIISNAGVRRTYPLVNLSYRPTYAEKYEIKVNQEIIFSGVFANLYFVGATTMVEKRAVLDTKVDASVSAGSSSGGTNGSTLRNGSGIPSNSIGADSDYYIDNVYPNAFYKRINGIYVLQSYLGTNFYAYNAQSVSYTLAITDGNKIVEMNSGTATNLTIPDNATIAYPVGTTITIVQANTGQVTIAGAAGVTILSSGNRYKLSGQFSICTIIKKSNNQWYLSGDLSL